MIKRILSVMVAVLLLVTVTACSSAADNNTQSLSADAGNTPEADSAEQGGGNQGSASGQSWEIAVVPKEISAEWFQRMKLGVDWFQADNPSMNAYFKGPDTTDATLQYAVIEDLIAAGVNAICVVPVDPGALEPILKEAMSRGIVVVTHEGSTQENTMYNVEAFDNTAYGEYLMQNLARQMNYEGRYIAMVGSVTNASHMDWAKAGIAYQQANYPNMELIEEDVYVEMEDDVNKCIEKIKELFKKYPDLKGILGTSGHVAPTAAELYTEMGLIDKAFVVGVAQPNRSREFIENGSLKAAICWDPAQAAYVMCNLAVKILNGEEISDGVDLGIAGYTSMQLVDGNQLYGSGWITETLENLGEYDF